MELETLRYNLSRIPTGVTVIDHFKELAEYKEFKENKNDSVARIVILATDEGSPFVKAERDDYEKRIKNIFDYLKIKDEHLFEAIISGDDVEYNKMVNRYFIMCDNLAYVMWSNMVRNFHFIGVALRQPPDMDDIVSDMTKRANLQKQLATIHEELVRYESQVFPDTAVRKVARKEIAKILQLPEKNAESKTVI